jgi:hypothetical protein
MGEEEGSASAIESMAQAPSSASFEDYLVRWSGTEGRAFASHRWYIAEFHGWFSQDDQLVHQSDWPKFSETP